MKAVAGKEMVLLKTYPYSDPSPLPEFGRLYPYNRFDGYTAEGSDVLWEMIVLENDFIKIWINPSAGGKVWGAIEKSTGREFIYFNHAAKFRDLAMRGPWTSGGIEINLGIIGHSPACAAKVDYDLRTNPDGSVSCFTGAVDWPSRTRWFVEICLPAQAAYFIIRTSWYNNSRETQSYYNWSNAGVKTSGDLEYIFPGSAYLEHDGKGYPWPKNREGRDLSFYANNNFGDHKSYHVFGACSGFWGCYWHKDNFGLGHYSSYDQKPGKKIWIWNQSRNGMIWEDLLTDHDGQYTEVQSGLLFNQSISSSSRTPFKHRSFSPYESDIREEYWLPVKGTGGLTYSCPWLSFFVAGNDGVYELKICANQPLSGVLRLEDGKSVLLTAPVEMQALGNKCLVLPRKPDEDSLKLWIDDRRLYDAKQQQQVLKRPARLAEGYDHDSVEGLYYQAKEWERQRFFERAEEKYEACLSRDPYYTRALTSLGALRLRFMDYAAAGELLLKTLSIDSYDAEANYLYGLVQERMGNLTDALDGFSIASQSPAYSSAAFTELARISLREKQYDTAYSYLVKALEYNTRNFQAYQLQVLIRRKTGKLSEAKELAAERLLMDPLDHFLRFELYKLDHAEDKERFGEKITGEMPHETYLELAALYAGIHCRQDAYEVLCLSPAAPMVELWKAYVSFKPGNSGASEELLEAAVLMDPAFVFPHRQEDIEILVWASARHSSWKLKFYLALAFIQMRRTGQAGELLNACGDEPSYYPFYLVRSGARKQSDPAGAEADLIKACNLAPAAWRTHVQLCKFYSERNDWDSALKIARAGHAAVPQNQYIDLWLVKCLIAVERPDESLAVMKQLKILPCEGAAGGRNLWREANLQAALDAIGEKHWQRALEHIGAAREWPENMGTGKPYEVDERLEDFLEQLCSRQLPGKNTGNLNHRIISFRERHPGAPFGSQDLLIMLALKNTGQNSRLKEYQEQFMQHAGQTLPVRCSRAFIEGDLEELEALSVAPVEPPASLPYEPSYEEREFPFLKKLYYMGLLEREWERPLIKAKTDK